MTANTARRTRTKAKGKGKQTKVFVEDKSIALELAQTIADKQEDKSKERIDKRHGQGAAQTRPSQKSRASSKAKLKEVTTALKAERAKAKRDKAKARKKESTTGRDTNQTDSSTAKKQPTQKRVSFV